MIQNVIDHWHVGKIKQTKVCDLFVLINTELGDFALVTLGDPAKLNQARADLLASNLQAKPLTKPKQAHVNDLHYQLWCLSPVPTEQRYQIMAAREDDYKDIEALALKLHNLDQKEMPELLKANPRRIISRGTYLNLLEERDVKYLVAKHAGEIVGYLYGWVGHEDFDLATTQSAASIVELYVIKSHRRNGIATSLISEFIEWSRKRKAKSLVTVVYSYAKPAQALYKKFDLRPRSIKLSRPLTE